MKPRMILPLLFPASLALSGCAAVGTAVDCSQGYAYVTPPAAAADHSATAPANSQQFTVSEYYPAGCAIPAVVVAPDQTQWTVSDPIDVQISSAHDATNGVATCLHATNGPVTVAPVGAVASSSFHVATLTCK